MVPHWTSGRISLNYVGTLRWRHGSEPLEYLAQPSELADWAGQSGLVTESMRVTPAQLATARKIREVIYRVVVARIDGTRPTKADLAALNVTASRPPVELSLDRHDTVSRLGTVSQLLSVIARDAIDLLGSDQIALVRECDGPKCSRLYVDSSRARNRRWCSNSGCGNQAKVAAFRRRNRSGSDS